MSDCHCFFFIDACGAEVIRPFPSFTDLAPRWKAVRSVFGYSSACVPSILSGLYPEEHGHWSFFTHRPATPGLRIPWWIRALPSALRDRGRVRAALSGSVARANSISGYFSLYQLPIAHAGDYGHCEPRDIFTPGGLNRGQTFIDDLHTRSVPSWVSSWRASEQENWAAMRRAAADPDKRFLFIYAASLDAWLHDNTRESSGLENQLKIIRSNIESVLSKARANHDNVYFHVFSDHGMATVRRHLNVFPILERSKLRIHRDYHAIIDSTMIRIWYGNMEQRQVLRNVLAEAPGISLLTTDTLIKERCNFPDDRFGHDIFLAEPHLLLVPSHMGKSPLAAMHGYDVNHPDSNASYLTNDPNSDPDSIVSINGCMKRAIDQIRPL